MSLVIDLIGQLYTLMLLDTKTPFSLALAGVWLVKLSVQSINYLSLPLRSLISFSHGARNCWTDLVAIFPKMTSVQVFETSVTVTNSSFHNDTHQEDHNYKPLVLLRSNHLL